MSRPVIVYVAYHQAEIAMRADGKPGMSDEEVTANYQHYHQLKTFDTF